MTPRLNQAELRKAYPNGTVQLGDPLGSLGMTRRWYVYRDGVTRRNVPSDDWWKDESLPTTILLDRDGRIARMFLGAFTEDALAGDIQRLLDEKP